MGIFDTLKKGKQIFMDAREAVGEFTSPVDSAEEINQSRLQSVLPSEVDRIQKEQAMKQGMIKMGDTYIDPLFSGGMKKIVGSTVKTITPIATKSSVFEGFNDLSTNVLEKLKGVGDTSERFILDTMQNVKGKIGLKQPEQNIYTQALFDTVQNGRVNANDFANRVKQDLLPLKFRYTATSKNRGPNAVTADFPQGRYERVSLPDEQRGDVVDYSEHIYESPIKTSAGSTHFSGMTDNYFGHTRIEDMADNSTRRVIEVQSDLFQKGRLESEKIKSSDGYPIMSVDETRLRNNGWTEEQISRATNRYENRDAELIAREKDIEKLSPYENIWHERLIREEVKQAAIDGKTKLQFPTGETAMKIEGLGDNTTFEIKNTWDYPASENVYQYLKPENLKVGQTIVQGSDEWIITDVLGDGKFRAISKERLQYEATRNLNAKGIEPGHYSSDARVQEEIDRILKEQHTEMNSIAEAFDISGKVDTKNPIYKFYESEVGKYLQKKYGATRVKDAQGVEWWEMNVDPSVAKQPVKAFGAVPFIEGAKSLFTDTEQTQTNEDGSTSSMHIPSGLKSLFGAKMEYKRTEAPQPIVPTQEEVVAPKVIQTITDIHGPYDELDTGTTVRPVREKLKSAIDKAYQSTPTIDKGVIEAILMKESSMGTNSSNKNPDIGKYAWLVGFTKIAKQELIRNGFNPDLDTPEGAIEAMARYWDLKDDNYDSPMDAYNHWYSSGKLTPEQLSEFSDMVQYYSSKNNKLAKN